MGSGMSVIAFLGWLVNMFIGINAIFMFVGVWKNFWRVTSIYCTLCMFVVQLIFVIVVPI